MWDRVAAERADTLAVVEGFSDEQWQTPSLCSGWTVKDVVGHIIWVASTRPPEVVNQMLLGGLRIDRVMADAARVIGSLPTEVVIGQLRGAITDRQIMPTMKPISLLADTLVHNQDICRPLGIGREIDPDRLAAALDQYTATKRFVGGRSRVKGLRLVATDLGFTRGDGPEVTGPAEAILLAATGRIVALDDLEGEGVATLRSRMTATP